MVKAVDRWITSTICCAREFVRQANVAFESGGWAGFATFLTDVAANTGSTYEAIDDGAGGAVIVERSVSGHECRRIKVANWDVIAADINRLSDPRHWPPEAWESLAGSTPQ